MGIPTVIDNETTLKNIASIVYFCCKGWVRNMARKNYILFLAILVIPCLMFALIWRRLGAAGAPPATPISHAQEIPIPAAPRVDRRNYNAVRTGIENERVKLWSRYHQASGSNQRATIISEARRLLIRAIYEDIVPYWYGTEWDFYGTTETPGQGKIACGYFVTTVLRDAGMKVQRVGLAQQASENILLSLTTNDHIKRFRRVPIGDFVEAVRSWGDGLYVVGLDNHVGFILSIASEVYFVHSSYAEPYCVVIERSIESRVLASSQYRVLGKLSEDDALIGKWLNGDTFVTKS